MKRTMPQHLDENGVVPAKAEAPGSGFGYLLKQSLSGVNDLQQESTALNQQMLINPDSVDAHDVTIAMAEASTSLSMARTILDRVLRAYREIINVR
ncbi:MAG: flagellar hook-basal body complex protein FliE [Spirochaetales bacterium]|nr:MAG: flagellar hook-basal body complex protein FliE [Spirochaetales bacterium]